MTSSNPSDSSGSEGTSRQRLREILINVFYHMPDGLPIQQIDEATDKILQLIDSQNTIEIDKAKRDTVLFTVMKVNSKPESSNYITGEEQDEILEALTNKKEGSV